MCEDLFVCASQVYYFLFPFWFYCNRSNANFNSAISFSRMILSFSSLVYFNNLSQACVSEINMSFLSLQRLWYESTNEYVTSLVLSFHPQVLAIMSESSSVCAIFTLYDHHLDLCTILMPFHRCSHDLTCKIRNSKSAGLWQSALPWPILALRIRCSRKEKRSRGSKT